MSSKIKYVLIDDKFPQAGKDNDSQGFRDNFDIIKQGLKDANEEVTDLQDNAARKDVDNDFANNTSSRINLKDFTQEALLGGTVPNSDDPAVPTNIDVSEGSYQTFVVSDNGELVFTNWPDENYACVYIELRPPETIEEENPPPYVVTFFNDSDADFKKRPAAVWDNAITVSKEFFSPEKLQALVGGAFITNDSTIDVPKSNDSTVDIPVQVFKFWTYDAGETIYAEYLGEYDVSSIAPAGSGAARILFLNGLFDVRAPAPNNGDTITYNSLTDTWDTNFINVDVERLDDIIDVDASNPNDGDTIIYNSTTNTWSTGSVGGGPLTIIEKTDTFSLTADSVGVYYRATSETPIELIVPADDIEFPIGANVTIIQSGLGKVTVAPNESVTVNSADGYLSTRTQFSSATLTKIASNQWDLAGDIVGDIVGAEFLCGADWSALGADQYALKAVNIGGLETVANGLTIQPVVAAQSETRPLFELESGGVYFGGISPQQGILNPIGDIYGDTNGSWSFSTENGAIVATSGKFSGTQHELFVRGSVPTDIGVPVSVGTFWTTGNTFDPDEFVIYYRVGPQGSGGDYLWELTLRPPNNYAPWNSGVLVQSQNTIVTSAEYNADPSAVYKVSFQSPGAFNSVVFTPASYGGVTIVDARLCKGGELMEWPMNFELSDLF